MSERTDKDLKILAEIYKSSISELSDVERMIINAIENNEITGDGYGALEDSSELESIEDLKEVMIQNSKESIGRYAEIANAQTEVNVTLYPPSKISRLLSSVSSFFNKQEDNSVMNYYDGFSEIEETFKGIARSSEQNGDTFQWKVTESGDNIRCNRAITITNGKQFLTAKMVEETIVISGQITNEDLIDEMQRKHLLENFVDLKSHSNTELTTKQLFGSHKIGDSERAKGFFEKHFAERGWRVEKTADNVIMPLSRSQVASVLINNASTIRKQLDDICKKKGLTPSEAVGDWVKKHGQFSCYEDVNNSRNNPEGTPKNIVSEMVSLIAKYQDLEKPKSEVQFDRFVSIFQEQVDVAKDNQNGSVNYKVVVPITIPDENGKPINGKFRIDYDRIFQGKDEGKYKVTIMRVDKKGTFNKSVNAEIIKQFGKDVTEENSKIFHELQAINASNATKDGYPICGSFVCETEDICHKSQLLVKGQLDIEQKYKAGITQEGKAFIPTQNLYSIVREQENQRDYKREFVQNIEQIKTAYNANPEQNALYAYADWIRQPVLNEPKFSKDYSVRVTVDNTDTLNLEIIYKKGVGEFQGLVVDTISITNDDIQQSTEELYKVLGEIERGERVIENPNKELSKYIQEGSVALKDLAPQLDKIQNEHVTSADKVVNLFNEINSCRDQTNTPHVSFQPLYPAGIVPLTIDEAQAKINSGMASRDDFVVLKDEITLIQIDPTSTDKQYNDLVKTTIVTGELPAAIGFVYSDPATVNPFTQEPVEVKVLYTALQAEADKDINIVADDVEISDADKVLINNLKSGIEHTQQIQAMSEAFALFESSIVRTCTEQGIVGNPAYSDVLQPYNVNMDNNLNKALVELVEGFAEGKFSVKDVALAIEYQGTNEVYQTVELPKEQPRAEQIVQEESSAQYGSDNRFGGSQHEVFSEQSGNSRSNSSINAQKYIDKMRETYNQNSGASERNSEEQNSREDYSDFYR